MAPIPNPEAQSGPRVYFIACCFPPFGRGNSLTNACAANGLAEDLRVEVVCMEQEAGLLLSYQQDASLVAGLHPGLRVHRVRAARWGGLNEILYALGILPCYYLNWAWKVWRQRQELFAEPGVLFAVYPVFSDLAVAYWLQRRYGYPLVVDFRDDFSGVMSRGWRRIFRGAYRWLEGRLLRRAARVTVTTEALKDNLAQRHQVDPGKIEVVYNIVPTEAAPLRQADNEPLRLVYAGAMSAVQRPEILLQAYALLVARRPELRQTLELDLYGPASHYFKLRVQQHLGPGITYHGFVDHQQITEQLRRADLGFLSLSDPVYAYATPTKLFEYIEYEVPMVGVLPPGASRDLINRHGLGLVAGVGDVAGLANCLEQLCCQPELRRRLRANLAAVKPLFAPRTQLYKWRAAIEAAAGRPAPQAPPVAAPGLAASF
ncbi:MAG: glycosyltransferase [Candidatus Latescibacteria bacterium]|nr:glycosyltransferase [Candidatus Latescibacterota bacterium]